MENKKEIQKNQEKISKSYSINHPMLREDFHGNNQERRKYKRCYGPFSPSSGDAPIFLPKAKNGKFMIEINFDTLC